MRYGVITSEDVSPGTAFVIALVIAASFLFAMYIGGRGRGD